MMGGKLPFHDPDYPLYSVAQVTEMLGVTAPALRRWEAEGLVHPQRTAGGQRRYSRREIDRLQRIAGLAAEGLATAGIRRVMDLEERIEDLEGRLAAAQEHQARGDQPGG